MSQITNVNSAYSKSLGAYPETNTPTNSKTLGGLDAPTDYNGDGNIDDLENYAHQLKSWLIQNYTNPQVDWATLNQYIQYVDTNLGSSIMGELGMGPQGPQGPQGPGQNMGTQHNKVYDSKVVDATASGYPMTYDIFGEEININVPFHSGKVTIEKTMDTRLNPPEEVVKVIVRSGIPEMEEVYFIHNTDAKIRVNVANQNQATNNTNGLDIEIGEYVEGSEGGSSSESNIEGEIQEDGTILYDGTGQDTIEFTPQASGVDGQVDYHDVEGDSDIIFKNTDEVSVEEAPQGEDYDFVVTVEHKDGSKDVFYIHKEYATNFTGEPSHIKFNGAPPIVATKDGEDIVFIAKPFNSAFTVNELETKEFNGFNFGKVTNANSNAVVNETYPEMINQLAALMGMEPEDLVAKIFAKNLGNIQSYDADHDGKLSGAEMEKAIAEKAFPPVIPNENLITFLADNDPQLKNLLSQLELEGHGAGYTLIMNQVTERLVQLLDKFYPGRVKVHRPNTTVWQEANNIVFDGVVAEGITEINDGDIGAPKWELFPTVAP